MLQQFTQPSQPDYSQWLSQPGYIAWIKDNRIPSDLSIEQKLWMWSAQAGQEELFAQLLHAFEHKQIQLDLVWGSHAVLLGAGLKGHQNIVELLLDMPMYPHTEVDFSEMAIHAAGNGDLSFLQFLVERSKKGDIHLDLSTRDSEALRASARYQKIDCLTFLLSLKENDAYTCDLTANKHEAIINAAYRRRDDIVKVLSQGYHERALELPQSDVVDRALSRIQSVKPKK